MPESIFDTKAFLDKHLFGELLTGWSHHLTLVSFMLGSVGEKSDAALLIFLESKSFAEDFLGLLEHGARLDHFRFPTPVGANTFFGSDGMPTISAGSARGRLLLKTTPLLIIEVRQVSGALPESIKIVQDFYDLTKERLKMNSEELAKKYAP